MTVLENGLKVVTMERPQSFTVSAGISINAGSFDEEGFPFGTAHFVEHMLFKGTETHTAKELNRAALKIGALLNAFTYYEETKYYASSTKDVWKESLGILFDLLTKHTLPAIEIDKERKVILEEIKMYEDDPTTLLMEEIQRNLFPENPERQGVLGTKESLDKINRETIERFIHTHYHYDKISIIVTGDVKHEEVVEMAKGFILPYEEIHAKPRKPLIKIPLASKKLVIKDDIEQAHFSFALFGPEVSSEETYAFDVLEVLLGGNETSRLFEKIREDRGLAYSVSTVSEYLSDYGVMVGHLSTSVENIEEVEAIVEEEMANICNFGISEEELAITKAGIVSRASMELDSNGQLNDFISFCKCYGQVADTDKYIRKIKEVTVSDVQFIAQKYFTRENYMMAVVIPRMDNE